MSEQTFSWTKIDFIFSANPTQRVIKNFYQNFIRRCRQKIRFLKSRIISFQEEHRGVNNHLRIWVDNKKKKKERTLSCIDKREIIKNKPFALVLFIAYHSRSHYVDRTLSSLEGCIHSVLVKGCTSWKAFMCIGTVFFVRARNMSLANNKTLAVIASEEINNMIFLEGALMEMLRYGNVVINSS